MIGSSSLSRRVSPFIAYRNQHLGTNRILCSESLSRIRSLAQTRTVALFAGSKQFNFSETASLTKVMTDARIVQWQRIRHSYSFALFRSRSYGPPHSPQLLCQDGEFLHRTTRSFAVAWLSSLNVIQIQTTVYNKGAEIIRLYETLLGKDGFRKGMDLYFQRHDGQAVTCDDFMAAMSDANGKDLTSLSLWYSQAGTPTLTVEYSYDPAACSFIIVLSQSLPSPGCAQPCLIPCRTALFGSDGSALPLVLNGVSVGHECVLELHEFTQTYHFTDVGKSPPVPSLLRGFSAPVNCVISGQSDADLQFLLSHDTDGFNRNEVSFFSTVVITIMPDTI